MAHLPQEIRKWLTAEIGPIDLFQTVHGGCINNTGSIKTNNHYYFIKWNSNIKFPSLFEKEAKGLKLLEQSLLRIPKIINVFEGTAYSCLLMENISSSLKSKNYWEILGEGLAYQHQITCPKYGLEIDNYMGSLTQHNAPSENWIDFFIQNRLTPQVKISREKNLINKTLTNDFEKLFTKLPNLLKVEPPSLLHGDLWNGNIMTDDRGLPVLIDPAVYYGNREVDLAMTKLFGGFDQEFYTVYQSCYPTHADLDSRIDIYNLYPLLIHLNLFGSSYLNQIKMVLDKFN